MSQDREQDQKNAPSHKEGQDQRTARPGQPDQEKTGDDKQREQADQGQKQR